MNEIIAPLANYGALGVMCGALVFGISKLYKRNCEMSDKIANIVEHNTQAMVELKNAIKENTYATRD